MEIVEAMTVSIGSIALHCDILVGALLVDSLYSDQ